MRKRIGATGGGFDFDLELPPLDPPQQTLVGPGRGVPPAVLSRIETPLDLADFYRTRAFLAMARGDTRVGRQDLETADQVEAETPVNESRFRHRIRTGNLLERHGLTEEARQYRLHTIGLFDR